jgi:hypothetical protein
MLHESPKYTIKMYCIFPVDCWSIYVFCMVVEMKRDYFPNNIFKFCSFLIKTECV